MNYIPRGKKVIVRPLGQKEEDNSTIIRPDEFKKEIPTGTIIAIGKDVTSLKVNDTIYFSPYHFEELEKDLFIMDDIDVWAVVN